uniref:Uncharacterized protein n=1 Tax=Arundo donax TaxID=35708 RepID=A0A0A9ENS7_ARUDO
MRLIASAPPASNPQLASIFPVAMPDLTENRSRASNVSKHVDATSCYVDVFGSGIGAMVLHSEADVPREDDSHSPFAGCDDTTNCDLQHSQQT